MSVRIERDVIYLEGDCGVEDAEPLASALDGGIDRRVNVLLCRHLHSAVVQALLAFRCSLEGEPPEGFLTRFVLPALAEASVQDGPTLRAVENSMERPE
jgi:hypothetical protein